MQPLPSVVPSAPFGNLLAPPVYSDPPMAPIPTAPVAAVVPTLPPPPTIPVAPGAPSLPALPLPPPLGVAPSPIMPTIAVAPPGVDHLQTMPSVLIAPVGREMLLKASIITREGYTPAVRRVDWSILPNGTAQFTEMGFRDRGQILSWWESPHRIDALNATTSTASVPITLNTATEDPSDDIPILRGESWVTLTSPTEGSSVVTAYAPSLDCYNQSATTIYWIDAQWIYNTAATAEAGCPYTLTTTVTRRTDGAPLPGYIVRYDVGAGGALGYEGGGATEATTDAAGRASVEVSPREAGSGVTTVGITIIRPATGGPAPIPQLELGRGATTITWGAPGVPVTPAPSLPAGPGIPAAPVPLPGPPGTTQPGMPAPSLPPTTTAPPPATTAPPATAPQQPSPYTPPPAAAATAGKPRLEVSLRPAGPDRVAVGQNASFELTVTNRGDALARHILIVDNFDRGLRHLMAQPNEYKITYDKMRDLPPNDSETIRLTFQVADAGMQCHEATITADGADPVSQRACVTAGQATLTVTTNAPRRQIVGDRAKINAIVKNTGETAATNIEIVARCDAALAPINAEQGHVSLPNGDLLLRVDRLEPGERRVFGVEVECKAPSNNACTRFIVTAAGGVTAAADACMEVLPQLGGASAAPGAAAAGPSDLRLSVGTSANPGRVRERHLVNVVVQNVGEQAERNVNVRVLLPQEFAIDDPSQIQPAGEATVLGQEVRFATIAELPTGQTKQYVIPIRPTRAGQVRITAEIAASSLSTPKRVESQVVQINDASP
jgi:hypothetical protein